VDDGGVGRRRYLVEGGPIPNNYWNPNQTTANLKAEPKPNNCHTLVVAGIVDIGAYGLRYLVGGSDMQLSPPFPTCSGGNPRSGLTDQMMAVLSYG
jgi:hypothetical protein